MPHKMTVYDSVVNKSLLGTAQWGHRRADLRSRACFVDIAEIAHGLSAGDRTAGSDSTLTPLW